MIVVWFLPVRLAVLLGIRRGANKTQEETLRRLTQTVKSASCVLLARGITVALLCVGSYAHKILEANVLEERAAVCEPAPSCFPKSSLFPF